MYKFVVLDTGDSDDEPIIDAIGLGHMTRDAIRLCQPATFGLNAEEASIDQIAALSMFACNVEEQGNARITAEVGPDNFFPERGAPALRLVAYLSEPEVWLELPTPFSELKGTSEQQGLFDPVMVMVLSARALMELDQAVALVSAGQAADAIKCVARASDCLAYANGLAGYGESVVVARTDEIKRRKAIAAQGGKGKADRYGPVRDWVTGKYAEKSWSSPRQAAKALTSGARDLSKELGCPLSEDGAFNTVYGWILKAS